MHYFKIMSHLSVILMYSKLETLRMDRAIEQLKDEYYGKEGNVASLGRIIITTHTLRKLYKHSDVNL